MTDTKGHTHMQRHTYIHTYTLTDTHIYTHTHIYRQTHTKSTTHTHTHTHTHTNSHTQTHTCNLWWRWNSVRVFIHLSSPNGPIKHFHCNFSFSRIIGSLLSSVSIASLWSPLAPIVGVKTATNGLPQVQMRGISLPELWHEYQTGVHMYQCQPTETSV